MTGSFVVASNNVYMVTFDGTSVIVASRRRPERILRATPLDELVAVDYKPARGFLGGSLRLRRAGPSSVRDTFFFYRSQEPPFRALATALQHRLAQRPAAVHPVAAPPPVTAPLPPPLPRLQLSKVDRRLNRLATIGLWIEGIPLVLMALILLGTCGVCAWVFISG